MNFTPSKTPKSKTPGKYADRFIPNRSAMNLAVSSFNLNENENCDPQNTQNSGTVITPKKEDYRNTLQSSLFNDAEQPGSKILAFKNKAPAPKDSHQNTLRVLYSQNKTASNSKQTMSRKAMRHIPQAADRILDAPEIVNNFYLNLLDWSSKNVMAVALDQTLYLWNASSGTIDELLTTPTEGNKITSVQFMQDGSHIAVGTDDCDVQLWDVQKAKQVRSLKGHSARVGAMAWNNWMLSTGSRDSHIFNHDVRQREHHTMTLSGHEQEVCGLKWNHNGTQLASGGNDNLLHIWDEGRDTARYKIDAHCAAVKAVAWCPHNTSLLATGGGTADRRIKFWNTTTGACMQDIDTGSQVCSLVWSPHEKEILSGHGYSQNQLTLWKYPTMARMADLNGHTERVLHMAVSPDGDTVRPAAPNLLLPSAIVLDGLTLRWADAWFRGQVVSAAADETLRFWRVFGDGQKAEIAKLGGKAGSALSTPSSMRGLSIR